MRYKNKDIEGWMYEFQNQMASDPDVGMYGSSLKEARDYLLHDIKSKKTRNLINYVYKKLKERYKRYGYYFCGDYV